MADKKPNNATKVGWFGLVWLVLSLNLNNTVDKCIFDKKKRMTKRENYTWREFKELYLSEMKISF